MQKALPAALLCALVFAVARTAAAQPPSDPVISVSANASLSVDTGIKTLLADPKAKEVIARYAPTVVEFFASGQAEGLVPAETPLKALAENQMAIDAGLSPENMKKIAAELAGR